MAVSTALATSFKVELLKAVHNFSASGGDAFKVALIKSGEARTYGAATTNLSDLQAATTDEVANGSGYTTGGAALTNIDPTSSGTTAFCDFNDVSWTTATFSTSGCLIYNTSDSNKAVSVHSFGGTQSVSAGTLTIQWPTADASNAIIRL